MLRRSTLLCMMTLAGCRVSDRPADPAPNVPPVADSQYAPSAMIARFRARVPEHPAQLGGGATASVDSLLARYVAGVEQRDTTALEALRLTASEFAWLYYLDSPMARAPYELDPDVMWLQISSQSARGLTRTLQHYGGNRLAAPRSTCGAARASGALRLLDCTVSFRPARAAADAALPLAVVERDGRYKLVGFGTSR